MTKNELLELVHNMANTCLDCKYPEDGEFRQMQDCFNKLKANYWYEASFGDTSDGSVLLRIGDYEQMKIWLNGVDYKNKYEELTIRINRPNIYIYFADNTIAGKTAKEPGTFVKCTVNTRKPHDLRFRAGDSNHNGRRREWWWTKFGELNAHTPGETDSYYLNDPYWEDIIDPEVRY